MQNDGSVLNRIALNNIYHYIQTNILPPTVLLGWCADLTKLYLLYDRISIIVFDNIPLDINEVKPGLTICWRACKPPSNINSKKLILHIIVHSC